MVIFFTSARLVYFNNFCAFSASASYVAKMHSIAAELVRHAHKLDMKLQSLCGNVFSLFAVPVSMLAKLYYLGVNWPTTLRENKDGVHFLPSILNVIMGITSYYCVILKMVILHGGIKTFQIGVFLFSSKKIERNIVSFWKPRVFPKKQVSWVKNKTAFSHPCV